SAMHSILLCIAEIDTDALFCRPCGESTLMDICAQIMHRIQFGRVSTETMRPVPTIVQSMGCPIDLTDGFPSNESLEIDVRGTIHQRARPRAQQANHDDRRMDHEEAGQEFNGRMMDTGIPESRWEGILRDGMSHEKRPNQHPMKRGRTPVPGVVRSLAQYRRVQIRRLQQFVAEN
ncbi:MAG: hypothetical protein AAFP90_18665, partial [Planctomycetota bacterium]